LVTNPVDVKHADTVTALEAVSQILPNQQMVLVLPHKQLLGCASAEVGQAKSVHVPVDVEHS